MNFINHSGESSLDSGDALECITTGVETVTKALRIMRGKPTPQQIGKVLRSLDEWKTAAQALLDSTEPPDDEDEDPDTEDLDGGP